jgi:hypothetical protein
VNPKETIRVGLALCLAGLFFVATGLVCGLLGFEQVELVATGGFGFFAGMALALYGMRRKTQDKEPE